ncbi:formate C-acetyltransferase [Candidatus Magnetomorum sp. HK-1]|nr:formate C-acetyltransferase [Candidatus Magnetomorum sp. HK-1]
MKFLTDKLLNLTTHTLLSAFAFCFNYIPTYRAYMKKDKGWINFSLGLKTHDGGVEQALIFHEGQISILNTIPKTVDVSLSAKDASVLKDMLTLPPNEVLILILQNKLVAHGNLAYLELFNYYLSVLLSWFQVKALENARNEDKKFCQTYIQDMKQQESQSRPKKQGQPLTAKSDNDPNVKYLNDPYLSTYSIDDFPRLKTMLEIHHSIMPEVCAERAKLITEWYIKNGFEKDSDGAPWHPELRQGYAFKYLMENKKPLISPNALLPGTTTAVLPTGVVIYPDAQGVAFWAELNISDKRLLNPYKVSNDTRTSLHNIFPFWISRNFREYVRNTYAPIEAMKIEERWVAYFCWKSVGLSHTIPDFPTFLKGGTSGVISQIQSRMNQADITEDKKNTLNAMILCLESVNAYAKNLSLEAHKQASEEKNPKRKSELYQMAKACKRVPAMPAQTLYEAVCSYWILWIAQHMENTNTGHSLGRLDQWLQPFFEADMCKLTTDREKQDYVKETIELISDFFMRMTDHLPLIPDIGNYLFGGASSDQAITLGGITPDGDDAVNDMTYIILKVTEILGIRDPNVNARIHIDKNSDTYIKRLCEVNLSTCATPSIHNDIAVLKSLKTHNYAENHINDWSATGCVEPTLSGRHMGHTGCILMNLVAGFEMALNNGYHPLMELQVGPETGKIANNDFKCFEDFFEAYFVQQQFLIKKSIELNNFLGKAHQYLRPTPFLSTMIDGAITSARDVTKGGARYNSSGSSNIGLADVVDSMLVIKKLVFDEQKITFNELKQAIDDNFEGHEKLRVFIQNKVPFFGSGNPDALEMCNRVTERIHDIWSSHTNYRGGPYTCGFWSMSQHTAYGNLSGALPSGRLSRKAFTPGLTPGHFASKNYLNNISDVAKLNPIYMDNNIAFNVKLTPSISSSRKQTVEHMSHYVKTYCKLGGMQMQFNVVSSDTLKDALVNPDNYKNLLVRISGYNAYFVTLSREQQIELIERTEYGV